MLVSSPSFMFRLSLWPHRHLRATSFVAQINLECCTCMHWLCFGTSLLQISFKFVDVLKLHLNIICCTNCYRCLSSRGLVVGTRLVFSLGHWFVTTLSPAAVLWRPFQGLTLKQRLLGGVGGGYSKYSPIFTLFDSDVIVNYTSMFLDCCHLPW